MSERRVSMDIRALLPVRGRSEGDDHYIEAATSHFEVYHRIPGSYESVDEMIMAIALLQEAFRYGVGDAMVMIGKEYRSGVLHMIGTYEDEEEE